MKSYRVKFIAMTLAVGILFKAYKEKVGSRYMLYYQVYAVGR